MWKTVNSIFEYIKVYIIKILFQQSNQYIYYLLDPSLNCALTVRNPVFLNIDFNEIVMNFKSSSPHKLSPLPQPTPPHHISSTSTYQAFVATFTFYQPNSLLHRLTSLSSAVDCPTSNSYHRIIHVRHTMATVLPRPEAAVAAAHLITDRKLAAAVAFRQIPMRAFHLTNTDAAYHSRLRAALRPHLATRWT